MTEDENISERFTTEQLNTLSYDLYRAYIEAKINREELFDAYGDLENLQKLSDEVSKRESNWEYWKWN